tara:strand:- start:200 stop:802 length:603 start_codon:yes stop_codon:yes gene_type:complete
MATTPLEIIRGIAQAAANAYDGALDHDGKPIDIGLSREEGDVIKDTRLIDGFGVVFRGDVLRVNYQSDIKLSDVYGNGFEADILGTINKAASFLKKEYKRITGNTLTLTKTGDDDVFVQETSRIRCFVNAHVDYRVGGLSEVLGVEESDRERTVDKAIKDWLGMNGNLTRSTGTGWLGNESYSKSKKPENVKGKRDLEPK